MLGKWPRGFPVTEAYALLARNASKVDDEPEDDEEHDQKNLQAGKEELDFAVDADKRDAHRERDEYEDAYPHGRIEIRPELEKHTDG